MSDSNLETMLFELRSLRSGDAATVKAAYIQSAALVSIAASLDRLVDGFAYRAEHAEPTVSTDWTLSPPRLSPVPEEVTLEPARYAGEDSLTGEFVQPEAKVKKAKKAKKATLAERLAAGLADQIAEDEAKDKLRDGAASDFLDALDDGDDADGDDFPIR